MATRKRDSRAPGEPPRRRAASKSTDDHGARSDLARPPIKPVEPQGAGRGPRPSVVIGLGASAGGLEALEQFFAVVPDHAGFAFVVVQHLERRHPSLLPELLGRSTKMPVRQIADGDALEPDRVFVIPPNTTLRVGNGVLRIGEPGDEPRMPIDAFFKSLADDQGELAVGILLSGTGSDGTFGLRAIKEQGGLALAQAPETAKHPGMPEHAIAAGFVDEALAISAMPVRLLEHTTRLIGKARGSAEREEEVRRSLARICELLRRSTGHDFSGYKEGTLLRRTRRRIQLLGLDSTAGYLERLAQDPEEPGLLLRDLLIGVTQFFREPLAFEALGEKAIVKLLEEQSADRPIRVWVPGCGTGEEVYSLAILFHEQLGRTARPIQLFATDIDTEALAAARVGRYRAEIVDQVSPERLERFFTHLDDGGYQIVKELRDLCLFSTHNLVRDPPFSSLDLVSCRNVLIYLEPELQKKVIPLLHYALKRSGFLFLGSSEELAGHYELFEVIDKKHRIFRRKETMVRPMLDFPLGRPRSPRGAAAPAATEPAVRNPKQTVLFSFERMLMEQYTPAAAVVDERGEMLCVGGNRDSILQSPTGLVTTNLLDHTQGTLRHALRTTLAEAVAKRSKVVSPAVITEIRATPHRLRVTVGPAPGTPAQSGLYAVVIEDLGATVGSKAETVEALAREPIVEQLENELRTTRADLQASNEELESAIEELKSSNEELLSTNEELQSTNEELQTSQEELQSVNEELETVNSELRQKVHELGVANSDLQNLFTCTKLATIFLDRELRLAKFTPAATVLFHFIDSDVGRPLSDLAPRFAGTDLLADVDEVLRTLMPVEREIRAGDAWFILRVLPYRTLDDAIAGAVITFADVTKLKRAEAALRVGERLLKDVIDGSPSPVFLKDLQGRFLTVNKRLEALLGMTREQLKGKTDYDIFPRERAEYYREHDRQVAESQRPLDLEETADLADGHHVFLASKFPLLDASGHIYGVGAISHDITERKRAEALIQRYARLLRLSQDAILVSRHGGEIEFWNAGAEKLYGYTEEEALGRIVHELLQTQFPIPLTDIERILADDGYWEGELVHRTKHGQTLTVSSRMQQVRGEDEEERRLESNRDITDRKRAEAALREEDVRKNEFLAVLSHELRNPLAPVSNSLYILEHTTPGSEQARRAQQVIERQVRHMTRLIDELLDVTRLSRGKIRLEQEQFDLSEIVGRTVEDHRAMFAAAGIDLAYQGEAGLWIEGDRTRTAQVVGNLLQNALKFTQKGGKVAVSLERADQARAMVRVRDTGAGMTPETLERVFQPFTQADQTLDRTQGGLGLGLALARGLVELQGGSIAARSEGLGKGSEFNISLPLSPLRAVDAGRASTRALGSAPATGSLRILIIEDNHDAADSLREALELDGHVVEVAYSGPDGLEQARTFRPVIVLCDIGLPEVDGYEVARTMRLDPTLGPIVLVALTGYAGPDDIAKSQEAGFDYHLAKPPGIEALERIFAEGRRRSQELPSQEVNP